MLFVFNNKEQYSFLKTTFSADDLHLDTEFNIHGAQEFIQDRVLSPAHLIVFNICEF